MAEERRDNKGPNARGPGERARWRRDLILVVALFAGLIGFYSYDQEQTKEHNRAVFVEAIGANCQTSYRQDKQLDNLIDLFVRATKIQARQGETPEPTTKQQAQLREDFLALFDNNVEPTPCKEQRETVEDALQ